MQPHRMFPRSNGRCLRAQVLPVGTRGRVRVFLCVECLPAISLRRKAQAGCAMNEGQHHGELESKLERDDLEYTVTL